MSKVDREYFIYHLLDQDNRIRYVGRSHQPYGRLIQHVSDAHKYHAKFYRWLLSQVSNGSWPNVRIVASVFGYDAACDQERAEIYRQLSLGEPVLNSFPAKHLHISLPFDLAYHVQTDSISRSVSRQIVIEHILRRHYAGVTPRSSR
jgi:hypothetical protein